MTSEQLQKAMALNRQLGFLREIREETARSEKLIDIALFKPEGATLAAIQAGAAAARAAMLPILDAEISKLEADFAAL